MRNEEQNLVILPWPEHLPAELWLYESAFEFAFRPHLYLSCLHTGRPRFSSLPAFLLLASVFSFLWPGHLEHCCRAALGQDKADSSQTHAQWG